MTQGSNCVIPKTIRVQTQISTRDYTLTRNNVQSCPLPGRKYAGYVPAKRYTRMYVKCTLSSTIATTNCCTRTGL